MEYQTNKLTNKQLEELAMSSKWGMNSMKISITYLYFSKQ